MKVKHIKSLVGMSIATISNYIDFKESPIALNYLPKEDVTIEGYSKTSVRQLDMVVSRKETFD